MRLPVPTRAAACLSVLLAAVLLGACAGAPTAPVSSVPTDTGGSGASGASGTYPGWPVGPVSGASVVPLLLNQQLAVGANRFLFTLFDAADQTKVVAAPDVTTSLSFYDLVRDPA